MWFSGKQARRKLRAETGAAAVDMESHIAAAYAEENGSAVRSRARDQRSRLARVAAACDGCAEARRQGRYLEGDAGNCRQSDRHSCAGLGRARFQSRAALSERLSQPSAWRGAPAAWSARTSDFFCIRLSAMCVSHTARRPLRAFSSEVDTGSRSENAQHKTKAPFRLCRNGGFCLRRQVSVGKSL